ncbi:unnamed protein product [Closterium sp. NIES-64]|nr:unnamed protein product [Closterium sp. NIES-64]
MVLSDWPCTSLERLRISGCGELERLPDSIAELLPRLRELTVFRCDALEELPEGFCSLEHLETLSVIECGEFRRVPESIGRLAALKTLVLEELPLSSLPDSMCQLGSLETFFLLSCKSIRELPADFCCLTALTTLCLGYVALPADMGRLSNLHTLLVRDILGHKHLPCSLSEVASLTRLELLLCGVEELPEGVGDLSSLRELHVSWCPQLTALPASVTDLTALEALSLADCENLASVPTRLDGLTRLKRLEVARCDRLTQPPLVLPASVEWLSWGNYSQAMALPEVSRLTGLGTLRLDVVAVACGVAVSRSLSHVEHLRLSLGGNAEELPFALTFLSRLRTLIIDCAWSLQRLPADIGSAVPQLRKLLLISAYKLRELPASVSALQNLTSLGVFDAPNLASLPPAIGALSGLRELLIGSCKQLEQLPASLTQLARLNQLTISNCPIRSLCPTAAQFQRLRSLSLSGCAQLEALPGDLGELKALRMLDVYDCRLVKDSVGSVLPRSINELDVTEIAKMIESTTSDLVERYLTPEKAFGGEGKSWLVTFLKVHKEGGGKQVRVRGVDGAGRPINHLYTMHERKLKGHKHGSTYADCVKLCRKFARDCVDNLTNRLDDLGKLGPTKLFRAGKWPKIKAQREKKCKEWLNGCSKLFRNKLPGFDIKAAERELPTFCAIMEAHHEMESFTQGLSNFLGSADSKR